MLKRLNNNYIYVDSPTVISVDNGIIIKIDADRTLTIEGQKSIKMKCSGDIDFDAKNISMRAKENVYIGSGKHLMQQAPRIDLNPESGKSGYKKNAKST